MPLLPTRDDEVVEVLPGGSADRSGDRRQRRQLAANPGDSALAVEVARRDLQRARADGDPRHAGLALAALRVWPDAATAPLEVSVLRATLMQFLHRFDESVATLRTALARPGSEPKAQGWLTLATVLRVQGAYDESDAACAGVERAGARVHAAACRAENASLRGEVGKARELFNAQLADPRLPAETRAWMLTSLAELEERDGRPADAEAAYRAIGKAGADAYAAVAYADFLIDRRRYGEALAALSGQPRTDPVLLRLAIAGLRSGSTAASADAAEMRERIALANERPDARVIHGREQALFALAVENAPKQAVALARGNVGLQREPIDIWLLAAAARAAGDSAAIGEARALKRSLGLHDRRIDALLR